MSSTIKNIFSDLENLISESSKYNTEVISETTKFLSNMDSSKFNQKYLSNIQNEIFNEAIQRIVKLNIAYTKGLMDLGVTLIKKFNETPELANSNEIITKPPMKSSVSAFKLETSAMQNAEASIGFLLSSDKENPILCKVQNTPFQFQSDKSVILDFKTTYSPQLFELAKGIPQKVEVKIFIPTKTLVGFYNSRITVAGFEHIHFELIVEVLKRKVTSRAKSTQINDLGGEIASTKKKNAPIVKKSN